MPVTQAPGHAWPLHRDFVARCSSPWTCPPIPRSYLADERIPATLRSVVLPGVTAALITAALATRLMLQLAPELYAQRRTALAVAQRLGRSLSMLVCAGGGRCRGCHEAELSMCASLHHCMARTLQPQGCTSHHQPRPQA